MIVDVYRSMIFNGCLVRHGFSMHIQESNTQGMRDALFGVGSGVKLESGRKAGNKRGQGLGDLNQHFTNFF